MIGSPICFFIDLGAVLFLRLIFIFFVFSNVFADELKSTPDTFFYEANDIFVEDGFSLLMLQGDAVLLYKDVFIKADSIRYSKLNNFILATGSVYIVRGAESIQASQFYYDLQTQKMRMDNVRVTVDRTDTARKKDIFNFLEISKVQFEFEKERTERMRKLKENLWALQEEYILLLERKEENNKRIKEITAAYGKNLRKLSNWIFKPDYIFSKLSEKERIKLFDRRKVVEEYISTNQEQQSGAAEFSRIEGSFLSIDADQIIRDKSGGYTVENAAISSCRCEGALLPVPIWQLSSNHADLKMEDSLDIYGSTVDIFSVPIVYTPYLKIPLNPKGRKAGLLYPSFYFSNSGQVIAQPLYIPFGNSFDTTLTVNYFSKRGSRFDGEVRGQVTDETFFVSDNQFIDDAIFGEKRWFMRHQANLALPYSISPKVHAEIVSDQKYLYDFSETRSTLQYLFTPHPGFKRFLDQEFGAEYYGSWFSLSSRAHYMRDMFADRQTVYPARLPRVEFSINPIVIGNQWFFVSGMGSWEQVKRLGNEHHIPSNRSLFFNDTSLVIGQLPPDSIRYEGERLKGNLNLILPLPQNSYVDSYLYSEVGGIRYSFQKEKNSPSYHPTSSYYKFGGLLEIPLFAKTPVLDLNGKREGFFKHDIKPFVRYERIPHVKRTTNYPSAYQLFYRNDNPISNETVYFGVNSKLFFTKEKLILLREDKHQEIARPDLLKKALGNMGKIQFNESDDPFAWAMSGDDVLYDHWARLELVNAYDQWEQRKNYSEEYQEEWTFNPISYRVESSYNVRHEKGIDPSFDNRYRQGFGEVLLETVVSFNPLVPIGLRGLSIYNPTMRRMRVLETETTIGFSKYVNFTYGNQFQILKQSEDIGNLKTVRTVYFNLEILPVKDVVLSYKFQKKTDTSDPQENRPGGPAYTSEQSIIFNNLQYCMDLVLARTKLQGLFEYESTYSVGINVKFLGNVYSFPQIADYLDSKIKQHQYSIH